MKTKESSQKNILKTIGVVSLITLISRILGLIREVVRANFLGTSIFSDAFTLAFSLPNLFRRLTAEGAMTSAFIPIYTEVREKEGDKKALAFSAGFFWFMTLILTLFCLAFIAATPWLVEYVFAAGFSETPLQITVFLTRLMFFYILFISLAAVFQGVLNSCSIFTPSAFTPVLLNISIIVSAVLLAPTFENPAIGFGIGVLIGGLCQLWFQYPFVRRLGFRFLKYSSFNDPNIKKTIKLIIPATFAAGIYQINVVISNLIATTLEEGSLSSLNFSNRLLELVLGVFIVSITTVILPRFSRLFIQSKLDAIQHNLDDAMRLISFLTFPVIAGTLLLSEDIVTLLFMRGEFDANSVAMTAGALQFHMIGLVFISWNRVMVSTYQAAKMVKITAYLSGASMIVNLISAWVFSRYMGHLGIALASSFSQVILLGLLLYYINKIGINKIGRSFFNRSIVYHFLLTCVMALIIWILKSYLLFQQPSWVILLLIVPIALIFYFGSAYLFKSRELKQLIHKNFMSYT